MNADPDPDPDPYSQLEVPMTNPKQTDEPIEFHRADVPASHHDALDRAIRQAREDAFTLVREALKERGDDDRWEFLQYCLVGAMEHSGYGDWMLQVEYDSGLNKFEIETLPGIPADKERRAATATIIVADDDLLTREQVEKALNEGDEDHPAFKITHETIELGLQRIRQATNVPDEGTGNWERDLTSVKGLGQGLRNAIIAADLRNDASVLDVHGYLAILEVACFGEVRYA